jgi:hypothetical protein
MRPHGPHGPHGPHAHGPHEVHELRGRVVAMAVAALLSTTAARADPSARVFAENPATTPTPVLLPLAMPPTEASLTHGSFRVVSCLDRGATADLSPWALPAEVPTCTLSSVAVPDDAGDFDFTPRTVMAPRGQGDPFAEASAYHHVARTLTFLRTLLPAGEALPAGDTEPLVVVVSGLISGVLVGGATPLGPLAHAMYLSSRDDDGDLLRAYTGIDGNFLWLGQSLAVNLAYDGDVVAHETVHAALDRQGRLKGFRLTPRGASFDPEALSEGVADYFAVVQTDNAELGEYGVRAFGVVSARSLLRPPADASLPGDAHALGLVYAGALYRLRQRLLAVEQGALDAALFRALRSPSLRADALFGELVSLVNSELGALGHDDVAALLDDELTQASLLTSAPAVVALDAPGTLHSSSGAFVMPGRRATHAVGALAPGLFQVAVRVPPGTLRLRGSVDGVTRRGVAVGAAVGSDPAPVLLLSWHGPITWAAGEPDALVLPLDDTGVFEVAVPAGATEAHLQVANEGDDDGIFTLIAVSLPATEEPVPEAPAVPLDEDIVPADDGCAAQRAPHAAVWALCAAVAARRRRRSLTAWL